MNDLLFYFKEKYRIPSTRLKHWNYSSTGWYFITVCAYQKNCYFGEIINGKMELSKIGKSVINQFKSSVKRYANKNHILFHWQSRFYDHIIRNEKSLNEIRQYIKNNPLKWENDEENPENIKNR